MICYKRWLIEAHSSKHRVMVDPSFGPNAAASSSRTAQSSLPKPPRVSQIDSDELDEGLVSMLGEKVERSLGNFRVRHPPSAPTS